MRDTPFDELFERMTRSGGSGPDDAGVIPWREGRGMLPWGAMRAFDVDVADDGETIEVTADLPGFDRADLSVRVDGRSLTLRAERTADRDEADGDDRDRFVRRERRHESLSRTIALPAAVEEGAATADYHNGVLSVTLPRRRESDDARWIDVA